jgi:hypothetical protein
MGEVELEPEQERMEVDGCSDDGHNDDGCGIGRRNDDRRDGGCRGRDG